MDGSGNDNLASGAAAAPPPPEVKVRTMRSDLDAMAKSGGGLPQFQNVKVAGLSMEKKPPAGASGIGHKDTAVFVSVAIAAVAALGIVGYFAYRFFLAPGGNGAPQAPARNRPAGDHAQSPAQRPFATAPVPATTALFTHVSLFKRPADQTLTLALAPAGAASSAADLQTFNQKLSAALASGKTSGIIEINMKGADGRDLGISDILSQANAQVISPPLLAAHFNPDATFFVYRDQNGLWPGYMLSLKPGENWLFSNSDVQKLESSPSIANLFLPNVGKPSPDGFTDSAINGTAVRILPFLDATVPAYFAYGWFRTYLIVSTSQAGFAQAVSRL